VKKNAVNTTILNANDAQPLAGNAKHHADLVEPRQRKCEEEMEIILPFLLADLAPIYATPVSVDLNYYHRVIRRGLSTNTLIEQLHYKIDFIEEYKINIIYSKYIDIQTTICRPIATVLSPFTNREPFSWNNFKVVDMMSKTICDLA
jgi:hypothetical protein